MGKGLDWNSDLPVNMKQATAVTKGGMPLYHLAPLQQSRDTVYIQSIHRGIPGTLLAACLACSRCSVRSLLVNEPAWHSA